MHLFLLLFCLIVAGDTIIAIIVIFRLDVWLGLRLVRCGGLEGSRINHGRVGCRERGRRVEWNIFLWFCWGCH